MAAIQLERVRPCGHIQLTSHQAVSVTVLQKAHDEDSHVSILLWDIGRVHFDSRGYISRMLVTAGDTAKTKISRRVEGCDEFDHSEAGGA
jgi:hypothetical protein